MERHDSGIVWGGRATCVVAAVFQCDFDQQPEAEREVVGVPGRAMLVQQAAHGETAQSAANRPTKRHIRPREAANVEAHGERGRVLSQLPDVESLRQRSQINDRKGAKGGESHCQLDKVQNFSLAKVQRRAQEASTRRGQSSRSTTTKCTKYNFLQPSFELEHSLGWPEHAVHGKRPPRLR